MNLQEINEKRKRKQKREISLKPLLLNINGRRFREDEINIKLADIYSNVEYDLNWVFPEIFDPWKRAVKHRDLFDEYFGIGRVDAIRFDHFFEYTHICDVYKWLNRAYQLLKMGGTLTATFIDFSYLFKRVIESETYKTSNQKIVELERMEKLIFKESDPSGMYYHRTILNQDRMAFYLERSFFTDYAFETSFHEVLEADIIELRAVKDTDKKTILRPDGTLAEITEEEKEV